MAESSNFSREFLQIAPYPGSKLKHLETMYYYSPKLETYEHLAIGFMGTGSFEMNHPFTYHNMQYEENIYKSFVDYSFFINNPRFDDAIPMSRRLMVTTNDLDKGLVDLAYVLQFQTEKFLDSVEYHLKNEAFFDRLKDMIPADPFESAMRKLYLIMCSFGSMEDTWAFTVNSKRDRRITYTRKRAEKVLERLRHVFNSNKNYDFFMDRYIKKSHIPVFFYLDPPYTMTEDAEHYTLNFSEQDHVNLKNKADEATEAGHKVLVCYDNSDFIKDLYKDYNIHKVDIRYTLNKNKMHVPMIELIITNYDDYAKGQYIEEIIKLKKHKAGKKKGKKAQF